MLPQSPLQGKHSLRVFTHIWLTNASYTVHSNFKGVGERQFSCGSGRSEYQVPMNSGRVIGSAIKETLRCLMYHLHLCLSTEQPYKEVIISFLQMRKYISCLPKMAFAVRGWERIQVLCFTIVMLYWTFHIPHREVNHEYNSCSAFKLPNINNNKRHISYAWRCSLFRAIIVSSCWRLHTYCIRHSIEEHYLTGLSKPHCQFLFKCWEMWCALIKSKVLPSWFSYSLIDNH